MEQLKLHDGTIIEVESRPDFCPICNNNVTPVYVAGYPCSEPNSIDTVFLCPNKRCKRMFIGGYTRSFPAHYFTLRTLQPRTLQKVRVVEEAQDISPQFAEIFAQATQAEQYGLVEIAGVGYRKSLEYLIKDYCVAQHPEKEEDIKKRPIAQVIESFVTNENIKQCAKRAIWLGNDETHYVRKWVDKDIKDLKLLIQITVNWIQQEVITKKLLEDMQ